MSHAIFSAEALRLFAHILHQLRTHDSFGKAGEILHQRGHRKLTSRLVALDHKGFQIGAPSVESGGVSGAAGADNDDIAEFAHIFCVFR